MQCVEQVVSSSGVRVFIARDRAIVLNEVSVWSRSLRESNPHVRRIGLFGSYAKGTYSPGSDLDIILIMDASTEPRWFMRSAAIDTMGLGIGADLFIYTESEMARMEKTSGWFRHIMEEALWFPQQAETAIP
ncbi:MAG: nucleotidyltransferase domain-containing protein [Spirochaetia bacterium]|jgi:predicted nucleotidyltransferase